MRPTTSTARLPPTAGIRQNVRGRFAQWFWKVAGTVSSLDLLGRTTDLNPVFKLPCRTLGEVGVRARRWARLLPCCYDAFIGVDRDTFFAANVMACRLGRPLASASTWKDGSFWMSSQVRAQPAVRNVLIVVNSSADEAADLVRDLAVEDIRADIGILFPRAGAAPTCTRAVNLLQNR